MNTKYNDYYREFINDTFKNDKDNLDDFNNDELNQSIGLALLEQIKNMNEKQNTIKNIIIFWLILTIINLVGLFYLISKFNSMLK